MSKSLRVGATAVAAFAAFLLVMLVMLIFGLLPPLRIIIALTCTGLVGWYTWRITADPELAGLLKAMLLGAIVIGGISFVAGFVGPIIFTPGANQGPLLGIFITGPVGFLLGAVVAAVRWFRRRRTL